MTKEKMLKYIFFFSIKCLVSVDPASLVTTSKTTPTLNHCSRRKIIVVAVDLETFPLVLKGIIHGS